MADPTEKDKCMRFRVHVLKEIYETEEAFVRKIDFVVQHVLPNARECKTLFSSDQLATVFCNIEDILKHHTALFASMRECIGERRHIKYESTLATCYLKHISGFDVYSRYGSNHEQAQRILREMLQDQQILAFFSGCMLLGDMEDDTRMDSFLVMPIQRICKYPLLMKELLKYTPVDHPDYYGVKMCMEKMKSICNATNEAKRRWEKLEEIAEWQNSIEGWEGPHVTESCNEMIMKGQLTKISSGNSQERQIFLLDNLLVYCKKTSTHTVRDTGRRRRSSSISDSSKVDNIVVNMLFRGRIALDNLDIENIEDGTKDYHSHGVSVYNGWKVHNLTKNKWFVLIAKHSKEKQEWMDAIRREKAKRKSRAMGIARNTQQLMLLKGERIYHSMTDAKSVIKDHKVKLRTHPKCFSGSELVTWLVTSKEASDDEQAVIIGQGLLEGGLIHHVLDKHNFQNNNLLYRFRYDDGTYRVKQESTYLVAGGLRIYLRLAGQHNSLLKDVKTTFSSSIRNVLSGVKLIDWLVQNEVGQNREQAMAFAQDLFGIKILRHINNEQGFKDISGVYYRFTPDDGQDGESSSKAKLDFNFRNSFACANIEVPYTSADYGFELSLQELTIKKLGLTEQKLKVTHVEDRGDAQAKGLCVGQVVVGINGKLLNTSEKKHAQSIINECARKSSPVSLLIERASSYRCELTMVANEGLGFHIKGGAPVIIYATDPGSAAARAGVVPGSCIVEVNNVKVLSMTHDEVVKEIKKVRGDTLPLRLAQPGLEHVMDYHFETSESQQMLCFEHIFESICTFSVPAQLLFLFSCNMTKFTDEVIAYAKQDPQIARFVTEIQKFAAATNKYATTLKLHGRWPSYKPYGVAANRIMDGCPTNCHTHVLTVTTKDDSNELVESYSDDAFENGTMENGWESELQDCTRYVFTTMAAPDLQTGPQKLTEEEQMVIQGVKEKIALLKQVMEELESDVEYIEKLVREMKLYSSNSLSLSASLDSRFYTLSRGRNRLQPPPENSPLGGRRLSQSDSFSGSPSLLTPDASPMAGRRLQSLSDPQPLLRLVIQGLVKKLPSVVTILKHKIIKHAYKETQKFSTRYKGFHQLLNKLEEESQLMSHDLEDTTANPSEATIELTKSLIDCIEKYINECRLHLMLYVALRDDVAMFQKEQLHFSQCLSAVLSTLSCQLVAALSGQYNPERHFNSDNNDASTKWLEQIACIGLLVKFEVLLLPDRDNESLQLKLVRSTVSLLKNVELYFVFENSATTKANAPEISCEGDQYGLRVTFTLPAHLKDKCPYQLSMAQGIKIHPVLFTKDLVQCNSSVGIVITDINNENSNLVKQYYKSYRGFRFDKNSLPTNKEAIQEVLSQMSQPLSDLENLITQLGKEVSTDQRNSVGLLSLATELCQRLGAVQIIMCDTGVHRSLMSLSLEQICILTRCHGLPIRSLRSGLRTLRNNGAYQILMQKNETDPNTSFSKEPVKLYRPPL